MQPAAGESRGGSGGGGADDAAVDAAVAAWREAMATFPDINVDAVKRLAPSLAAGSAEAAEAAAVLAALRGDMAALAKHTAAIELDGADVSTPSLKLAAAYYLAKGSPKVAAALLLRAGDAFYFAELQAWRRAQSVWLDRKPEVKLAVVAALKDEAEYLEEWITFHASIGVERFYLYENHSTDGTLDVLKRLSRFYDIRLHSFEQHPAQMLAYNDFLRKHGDEVEWAAFIDGDEFIRPVKKAPPLSEILEKAGDAAGIALNWTVYGSAGHQTKPEGLGLEAFQRSGGTPNRAIKSILRPARVILMPNPHMAVVSGKYVTPSGRPCMPFRDVIELPALDNEPYGVAHYAVRSREQFQRKRERGRAHGLSPRDEAYFKELDRNEVADATMAAWAPTIQQVMKARGTKKS